MKEFMGNILFSFFQGLLPGNINPFQLGISGIDSVKGDFLKNGRRAVLCLPVLGVVLFSWNDARAFDYIAIHSGDSYQTVREYLLSRGNKVVELDENRLTTADNSNILATFEFKDDKLCRVLTNYNERNFKWILSFIDLKTREYGSPVRMVAKGENWGDGFIIHWQNDRQTLLYNVGKLDLYGRESSIVKSAEIDGTICKDPPPFF